MPGARRLLGLIWFLGWIVSLPAADLPAVDLWGQARQAYDRQDWSACSQLLTQFLQEQPEAAQAPDAAFYRSVALYQAGEARAALDGFQKLERTWPLSKYQHRLPYWKGAAALAAGLYAQAEKDLLLQSRYPDEVLAGTRAWLQLALTRLKLNRPAEAGQDLRRFLKLSTEKPLRSQAAYLLGQLAQTDKKWDEADRFYSQASAETPLSVWDRQARQQQIAAWLERGQPKAALTALEAANRLFPALASAWTLQRVEALRASGDRSAARAALASRLKDETDPGLRQKLLSNQALLAAESGSEDPSLWALVVPGPDAALAAMAVGRQAWGLERSGTWSQAAAVLSAWLDQPEFKNHPARSGLLERAAADWRQAGELTKALSWYQRGLGETTDPGMRAALILGRGQTAFDQGDSVAALRDSQTILNDYADSPQRWEASYLAGMVYLQRQEPIRAEAWFYPLIEELKTGELYQRALLARGMSFANAGQTDLARATLQRLIREAPQGAWTGQAWFALGKTELQVAHRAAAIEAFGQAQATSASPADQQKALWAAAETQADGGEPEAAAQAFADFARRFPSAPEAAEAWYRQGYVFYQAEDWNRAQQLWIQALTQVTGPVIAKLREGVASALLRLQRPQEGWAELERLEKAGQGAEAAAGAWYRWGQIATSLGLADWAVQAYQTLIVRHPESSFVELALPRAAGALLGAGNPTEAWQRYQDYFQAYGQKPASVAVARAAAAVLAQVPALQPRLLEAIQNWPLAPEVRTEWELAYWNSQLPIQASVAQAQLQALSQSAPWTSQRSQALTLLGQWACQQSRPAEARLYFQTASQLGDDLSRFRGLAGLAQVLDLEGKPLEAAAQRESAEQAAGPGVPREFRVQLLNLALAAWHKAGVSEAVVRVESRLKALAG